MSTKLHIPAARPQVISRPRLHQRLNQCTAYRLLLVSAPAGSGKSTLLGQWSHQSEWPVVWVSLDARDNDPAHFWSYLVMALDKLEPKIGQHLLPLIHSPRAEQTEYLVAALINLVTLIPDHFVLILDDYHWIETEEIHTALAYLLDYLPATMHLVLASRTEPPLPLARWRARGQLLELRLQELRFSLEETETLLNEVIQLQLSRPEVAALQERTEGWIAGLQLAALAAEEYREGQMIPSLPDFQGNHRYLVDYLASEVLHQQPEPLQRFLLKSAILDSLNESLCEAVTGQANSGSMLEQLHRRNLFITRLDRQGQYRYQPLFAGFLQAQLQREPAYDPAELHGRAMDWYEQQGQLDQAIRHALAAGCIGEAAELIHQTARHYFMRGEANTLLQWFRALPDQIIRSRPLFCLIYAWVLTNSGQVAAATPYLDHLEAHLSGGEEKNLLLGEAATVRARIGAIRGDLAQVAHFSQQALALLPPEASLLRSSVLLDLAGVCRSQNDFGGSQAAYLETITLGRETGNLRGTMLAVYYLADLYLSQGEFQQAAQLYQQGLAWCRQTDPPSALSCWAHAGLGALLYEWNQLDEAVVHLRRAIELSHQCGEVKVMMYARIALAQVLQSQGQVEEALAILQAAADIAQQSNIIEITYQVELARVKLWLRQGQVETAAAWLQQHGLSLATPSLLPHGVTMLAWLRLAQGQSPQKSASDELEQIITRLTPRYEAALAQGLNLPLVQELILLALVYQAWGQTDEAVNRMAQALDMAEPMDLIRTFSDYPAPAIATLLRQVAARKQNSPYLHKLLATFEDGQQPLSLAAQSPAPPADALVEPLNAREIEVLQYLDQGLSNQEIAEEMILAVSTVKWYLRNIYDKLQVNRRTQALARARELNLLYSS